MKAILIVMVCTVIVLGVFNAFWVERDEAYLVAYVREFDLSEALGGFTALEEYSRNMLGELQMISDTLDDLMDTLRAFEDVEDFGDALLAVVRLLGGLLWFLASVVFHLCTIIVIHVYSLIQLVTGIFNLLLGL